MKLMKDNIPTFYCDTSFILEYWEANVSYENTSYERLEKENEPAHYNLIRDIVGTEKKIEAIKPLRRLIDKDSIQIKLVSSAFALLEIYEKHAEWNMKSIIAESTNLDRIFNKGKKQMGDYIEKLYKKNNETSNRLFGTLFPRNLNEDLYGIEFLDLQNLNLSVEDVHLNYFIFSTLQVGSIDIMHLLAANHIKAEYFISFDSDFMRIKEIIEKHMHLKLIYNVDELNKVLKNFNKDILTTW